MQLLLLAAESRQAKRKGDLSKSPFLFTLKVQKVKKNTRQIAGFPRFLIAVNTLKSAQSRCLISGNDLAILTSKMRLAIKPYLVPGTDVKIVSDAGTCLVKTMKELNNYLATATSRISKEYFVLPVCDSEEVYRE